MTSQEGFSINKAMTSYNRRFKHDEFLDYLKQVRDVENAESCVALGAGTGSTEVHFVKNCMPNLKHFMAVEPEKESFEILKSTLHSELSNMKYGAVQSYLKDWSGPAEPVDAILAFHVWYYFTHEERIALLQTCMEKWLKPTGKLVSIIDDESDFLAKKLFTEFAVPTAQVIVGEVESLGYSMDKVYNHRSVYDLTDIDDDFVRLSILGFPGTANVSVDQMRKYIEECAPDGSGKYHVCIQVIRHR